MTSFLKIHLGKGHTTLKRFFGRSGQLRTSSLIVPNLCPAIRDVIRGASGCCQQTQEESLTRDREHRSQANQTRENKARWSKSTRKTKESHETEQHERFRGTDLIPIWVVHASQTGLNVGNTPKGGCQGIKTGYKAPDGQKLKVLPSCLLHKRARGGKPNRPKRW